MPSVALNIEFNNETGAFFPGQTIDGKVYAHCTKNKVLKDLCLKVQGHGRVEWKIRRNDKDERIVAKEDYYNIRFSISGRTSLSVGVQGFPFSFILPTGIPSSFETNVGYVRHTLKATADIEDKFFDVKESVHLSVISIYDLNLIPEAKDPIALHDEQNLCCLCCKNGNISFYAKIGHSGYVPGQDIVIDAECHNGSFSSDCQSSVSVIQKVTYKARSKTKKETTTVCSSPSRQSVGPGEDDVWSSERLTVPAIPPSSLPGCSLIDIKYELCFKFSPSGMSCAVSGKAPLVIGTIPLRQVFSNFFRPESAEIRLPFQPLPLPSEIEPSAPAIPPHADMDPPPAYPWAEQYPDLPPPSYKECAMLYPSMLQDSDNEEESNPPQAASKGPFVPRYMSYGWM